MLNDVFCYAHLLFECKLKQFITSVGQKRTIFCYQLLVLVVSLRMSSSSFGCLEKDAFFYCGPSWAFNITIVQTCMPY